MKSQFEKPHSTTRQREGHNTSHKYAPSYENQVWLSQWPPLLSCCPKPDWENKISVVLFIRLFVSGGRRRDRDRVRVWGTALSPRPPHSRHSYTSHEFYRRVWHFYSYLELLSNHFILICYELWKVEFIHLLFKTKTVYRIDVIRFTIRNGREQDIRRLMFQHL